MNRPWLDLLTESAYSPTWRRNVRISKRQWRLLARTASGGRFNQRDLATGLGYSLGGLHAALESMVTLGLAIKRTARGRKGWTFVSVRNGALAGNVHEQGRRTSREISPVSLLLNISPKVPPARSESPPERAPGPSDFREKMRAAGLTVSWG
jgi:DNA-binding MarR family transcriptional regulator